jgi:hypothetical protein
LSRPVTDLTATLSAEQVATLENKLTAFEAKKGSQIAVLIVPTTQPEDIAQFGIRVADAWKVGRKKIDDGVILIVAKDDRRLRLEVGYGLEGAIPDAIAKRVIAETITPYFKAGDFYGGIAGQRRQRGRFRHPHRRRAGGGLAARAPGEPSGCRRHRRARQRRGGGLSAGTDAFAAVRRRGGVCRRRRGFPRRGRLVQRGLWRARVRWWWLVGRRRRRIRRGRRLGLMVNAILKTTVDRLLF